MGDRVRGWMHHWPPLVAIEYSQQPPLGWVIVRDFRFERTEDQHFTTVHYKPANGILSLLIFCKFLISAKLLGNDRISK